MFDIFIYWSLLFVATLCYAVILYVIMDTIYIKIKKKREDKMSKFKVGDKVRLVSRLNEYSKQLEFNKIYTIKDVNPNFNWSDGNIGAIVFEEPANSYWLGDFELFTPNVIKHKFNIGDKVYLNGYDVVNTIESIEIFYTLKGSALISTESSLTLHKEPIVKELTVQEISGKLGYEVKIIK